MVVLIPVVRPAIVGDLCIADGIEDGDGDVCCVGGFEEGMDAIFAVWKGESVDFLELLMKDCILGE